MSEILLFIASHDDTIQFCKTDVELGRQFQKQFAEKQNYKTTFDPYISLASNPDLLDGKIDFFTTKLKPSKRQMNAFDIDKYCKYYITTRLDHIEDSEKPDIKKDGFDAYAYLMAYEDEIDAMYSKKEITHLQKAALHFIEIGREEKELDYIKYVATHDDLVNQVVESKTDDKEWIQHIEIVGKEEYELVGKTHILSGERVLLPFFNALKYLATYPAAASVFKNPNGIVDEIQAALAYITVGFKEGFIRDNFNPFVYLANYPELIKEDIYVNGEISISKVAKLWIDNFKNGINLDKFDPTDFIESMGLEKDADAFKVYVETKVEEYNKFLSSQKGCFNWLFRCGKPKEFTPI